MAFRLYSTDDGHVPAWEYLPAGPMRPLLGMAMALDPATGQLKKSNLPQFICMRDEESAVLSGTLIPVVKITKDQVWESEFDGNSAWKVGTVCDVAADGLTVDGDGNTNKNFLLTAIFGNTPGSTVRGRFAGANV